MIVNLHWITSVTKTLVTITDPEKGEETTHMIGAKYRNNFANDWKTFQSSKESDRKIDKTIINIAYFILFLGNIVVLSASYGASKSYSVSALFFFMVWVSPQEKK